MLEAAIAGAVAGLAIAGPVGAIAVLIIQTGLSRGVRAGLAAGAGTATADGIYATIAVLAGIGVSALIGPLVTPLRVVGAGSLPVTVLPPPVTPARISLSLESVSA